MEKRVLLAIFLIAVVLVLSNLFLSPPKPEKIAPLGEKEVVDEAEEKERESLEETGTGGQEVPLMTGVVAEGDTIIVETDIYRLGISSVGGRLISMELKEYSSYMNDGGVRLIPPRNSSFLNMRVTLERDTLDLGKLDFSPSTAHIHAAEETKVLVLAHPVGRGDSIKMKYTFNPGVYVIDIELFLPGTIWKRDRQLQVDLLPRLLPTELDSVRNDINYFGTIMGRERGGVEKVDLGDLDGEKDATAYDEGPFLWAGIKNKYFVAALVARNAPLKGVISKGAEKENRIGITAILPPGEKEGEFRWTVYLGPQDYYRLSALGVGLEDIVEYGWWIIRPFTRMIVVILLWMHQFIRNYGVVIIVFSVMTKVAFYPLTQKSMKAPQHLQRIQPMMKELREKHKK
ncbi:MAG: membrane protein insertase YidC, partial [Thermodesulfobacteriota bacterium]